MNLYLLTTREPVEYDEHYSFVVAAVSGIGARAEVLAWPNIDGEEWRWSDCAHSTCTQIGTAAPDVAPGVVLASFNAG